MINIVEEQENLGNANFQFQLVRSNDALPRRMNTSTPCSSIQSSQTNAPDKVEQYQLISHHAVLKPREKLELQTLKIQSN